MLSIFSCVFKNALQKPFGEFEAFPGMSHPSPCLALSKLFSAPNSDISVCLTSLCVGHMNL